MAASAAPLYWDRASLLRSMRVVSPLSQFFREHNRAELATSRTISEAAQFFAAETWKVLLVKGRKRMSGKEGKHFILGGARRRKLAVVRLRKWRWPFTITPVTALFSAVCLARSKKNSSHTFESAYVAYRRKPSDYQIIIHSYIVFLVVVVVVVISRRRFRLSSLSFEANCSDKQTVRLSLLDAAASP